MALRGSGWLSFDGRPDCPERLSEPAGRGNERGSMVVIGQNNVDVELVLDELGIIVVDRGDNLLCMCPFHDDQHRSFSIHATSGAWICYAGCGEGGLVKLAAEVRGTDNAAARLWLEDRGEAGGSEDAVLQLLDPPVMDAVEEALHFYETGATYSYILNRGFTVETLKIWGVGRDTHREAVVIPVQFKGKLVGLIYRHIRPEVDPPYEYTWGLPKSEILFGWDLLPPTPGSIIVVEGPLDAMWLGQHRYPGVAVLGNRLSEAQANLLVRRTRTVVLALDGDKVGERGTQKAIELLTGRVHIQVVRWPLGRKDAQECGITELLTSLGSPVDAALWGVSKSADMV